MNISHLFEIYQNTHVNISETRSKFQGFNKL